MKKIQVIKKNMANESCLIGLYSEDRETIKSLRDNIPFEICCKGNRDSQRNRKFWACLRFYQFNLPERFDDELKNKTLYYICKWFQIRIGYTGVMVHNGVKFTIPKDIDFHNLDDEQKFIDEVYTPIRKLICEDIGFDSTQELDSASAEYEYYYESKSTKQLVKLVTQ